MTLSETNRILVDGTEKLLGLLVTTKILLLRSARDKNMASVSLGAYVYNDVTDQLQKSALVINDVQGERVQIILALIEKLQPIKEISEEDFQKDPDAFFDYVKAHNEKEESFIEHELQIRIVKDEEDALFSSAELNLEMASKTRLQLLGYMKMEPIPPGAGTAVVQLIAGHNKIVEILKTSEEPLDKHNDWQQRTYINTLLNEIKKYNFLEVPQHVKDTEVKEICAYYLTLLPPGE